MDVRKILDDAPIRRLRSIDASEWLIDAEGAATEEECFCDAHSFMCDGSDFIMICDDFLIEQLVKWQKKRGSLNENFSALLREANKDFYKDEDSQWKGWLWLYA